MTILSAPKYVRDSTSPLIKVTDFGADPTGVKDSTEAFKKAVSELLSRKKYNCTMADGINDLGGAVIDLEGGNYTISDTILFPYYYGNYYIKDGAVRASLNFPNDKFMFQFGGDVECKNIQGCCIENIGISHLFFDGSHIALGLVKISKTMGSSLGPQLFFTGFYKYGLYLDGGHESMLHQAWFGAHYYSYPSHNVTIDKDCTAVYVHGNDHYIADTIVFQTPIGMVVLNEATVINGFHAWNDYTEYALIIRTRYVRMTNSYIDYSRLLIEGDIDHIIMENTFFLEATLVLEPHSQTGSCQNFFMLNSDYQGGSKEKGNSVIYSQKYGKYTTIRNVKIENVFHTNRDLIRMTKVKLTKKQSQATSWVFDLSNKLVFNRIGSVQYSIQNEENKFVQSYIKPFQNDTMKIEIVTSEPVTGTIFLTVDENNDD